MLITAASDSLRGVFLPQFRESFSLTEPQAGRIIMISYIGNLLFLSIGGVISDKVSRKRFLVCVMLLWSLALLMHTVTENYYILLFCVIFSMGGSTLIATNINLITPLLFASPAMLVSIFNFLQGIGITVSQNIGGRFADKMSAWHIANLIILCLSLICIIILLTLTLPSPTPDKEKQKGAGLKNILANPASFLLILTFGGYFIAEHGLMNWLTSYGSEHLGLTVARSAFFLSMFFGGITLGRLIFAPVIDRIGIFRSLLIWAISGTCFYIIGIILGAAGMWLLAFSGLWLSIVYPMLVMLTGKYFPSSQAGSATGLILSIATFFDIGFNAFFGTLVESAGFGRAIIVLPVSAGAMCIALAALKLFVKRSKEIK